MGLTFSPLNIVKCFEINNALNCWKTLKLVKLQRNLKR
nr:MAG TPA: hypothetical protein [Caudoviricetes sp.]